MSMAAAAGGRGGVPVGLGGPGDVASLGRKSQRKKAAMPPPVKMMGNRTSLPQLGKLLPNAEKARLAMSQNLRSSASLVMMLLWRPAARARPLD